MKGHPSDNQVRMLTCSQQRNHWGLGNWWPALHLNTKMSDDSCLVINANPEIRYLTRTHGCVHRNEECYLIPGISDGPFKRLAEIIQGWELNAGCIITDKESNNEAL